jgi:hypothetical protein
MPIKLENYGSFGAIVAAAACPICFPKLALIGAYIGLGALARYEVFFFYIAQILIVIALTGHVISYQKVKNKVLLAFAVCSAALFFVSLYVVVSEMLAYLALAGLVIAMIWMAVESRRCSGYATSAA